eukprot:GFUD01043081.1.p1 GENE.GFUD01043081.1~~GFUD01043081.1.p1  ORF type:complete len:706 (-),score=245.82 GFUD01043081.1:139-2256(-)
MIRLGGTVASRVACTRVWPTVVACRQVSSLGPLAAAFNTKQNAQFKFQWSKSKTGLFGLPELKDSQGFHELKERCISNAETLVEEVISPNRKRNVAVIFDDLSDELCRVADLAEFIRLAHPDQEFALAAQDTCIAISGLVEQLNTHIGIYTALKQAVEQGDLNTESDVDKHVAKLFLQDFQQCGIHLGDKEREQVVELNDRILRLGQQFSAGCHQPRVVRAEVLPAQIRNMFYVENNGNIVVSGQHIDSPSDMVREAAYKIYYWRDQQQEEVLTALLEDRFKLARLCGYQTAGHRAVANSLGQSPENIGQFLTSLASQLPDRVAGDHMAMSNMKRRTHPMCSPLAMWDVPYFSGQARGTWFSLDLETVCEYFSLGVAMEGLNELFQSLYGVELVVEDTREGELWAQDVFKLAVKDSSQLLGHIYCDFFKRAGKPHQDCHFTIRGGREKSDGSYQDPVVVLMLNLPPPGWRSPTLLSPSTLDNLFHEMGHAMHSMLGRTKYQHVTGTRCSTDFAEVPSTLMEYFASDPRVLARVNRHYKTGEKLPEQTIQKLCATKKIFAGTELQAQLFYSAADQLYHSDLPLPGDITTCLESVQTKFHTLPYVPGTAYHLRFSHLVGYGARYYSYLLARSVASAIWQHSFQGDPFCGEAGGRYRRECLEHGGGKASHLLVGDYLEEQMEPGQLAAALIQELDTKNREVEEALACQ